MARRVAFLGWGFDRDLKTLKREIKEYGLPEKLQKEILN